MRLTLWLSGLLLCLVGGGRTVGEEFDATTEAVGRRGEGLETPLNQRVTPAGKLVEFPDLRPAALALSPDGKLLVTAGRAHELMVVDPATGTILQHVRLPAGEPPSEAPVSPLIQQPDSRAQLSFTGLAFSPDGSRIYLSNVTGDIKVFAVGKDRRVVALQSFSLPRANAPRRAAEIPAGVAVSADGKRLYVALNLSNRLAELDAATGRVLRLWKTGVAPFGVGLCRDKAYVSNWGGRLPEAHSTVGPAGRGMLARVDERGIACEGSVTVIDLRSEREQSKVQGPKSKIESRSPASSDAKGELLVGLRPCALALSPDTHWLVVANAGSDSLSVIDTRTDTTVETICARRNPADLFGAQPNALAFDKSGRRLYVCNGTQNAVAVFDFKPGQTQWLGLVPVGWFPAAIIHDPRRDSFYVANLKHLSPAKPVGEKPGQGEPGRSGSLNPAEAPGDQATEGVATRGEPPSMEQAERALHGKVAFRTSLYCGSLSLVRVPSGKALTALTQTALANLRYPLLAQAAQPPRPGVAPCPVPERVGEPSVFRHVVYIIKENCAYDQVLGDVAAGNGNRELCVFGERVTPNQHKLCGEFVLLDNTYCCGILSADGHEWATSALATDYLERSFAGWPRSYPAGNNLEERDALAYSPAGFIWDDALKHGRTVRDFGEFTLSHVCWKDAGRTNEPGFLDCYRDFVRGSNAIAFSSEASVSSLAGCVETNTVGWSLNVPDVFRARQFIRAWHEWERSGSLPDLVLLWLPSDHTSGAKFGWPIPAAYLADNDLAFGQVLAAISHSAFWKDTCVFAIEDDPQNGWDHVSGYRTTAYVASPYTKRHATINTQYNQTSVLRTIELILGLPPMNQMDATATPMFDCFLPPDASPDYTAFEVITNQVPLDRMNPAPKKVLDRQLRKDAYSSARLPFAKADQCPVEVLRPILWRAAKGPQSPFPAWAAVGGGDD